MSDVHIYRQHADQPATRWVDDVAGRRVWHRNKPNRLLPAFCCGKRRPAKNCTVQAYYDGIYVFCRPETGCKIKRARLRPCPAHGSCRGCAVWKGSRA